MVMFNSSRYYLEILGSGDKIRFEMYEIISYYVENFFYY